MIKRFWIIFCFFILIPLNANAFQPLPRDQAFALTVKPVNGHTLLAQWDIAPGYHLYRERLGFNVISPTSVHLGDVTLPAGIAKQNNILGQYQVYKDNIAISLPIIGQATKQLVLAVSYQGCADSGFCYPPTTKQLALNLEDGNVATATDAQPAADKPTSSQDKITQLLAHQNLFFILLGFLGFGLLLAFTPCVLPMIPILSGIIVGQGEEITALKAFFLSLTYVMAMAVTYALAGVVAGLAGNYVQALLQSPWVIASFSGIFVLLAFSLFGFYELQLPQRWHHRVTHLSNRHSGGNYFGVAAMGCLSTLILSPCVTAPLIGALSYIGKTGNAWLGGSALFIMGVGMGVPLLIIGTVGSRFMPKSGPWMDAVKSFFGVLMLGVAILLLGRVISPVMTMILWAGLLVISSVYMGVFTTTPNTGFGKLWKGLSIILMIYGFLLLIGAGMGNTDPLQPLTLKQAIPVTNTNPSEPFRVVKSIDDLQQALTKATADNKPVMLDFSADWCISCKELDRTTFKAHQTQALMGRFVLLRADVTANDEAAQALEKKFGVIAPPTILFFDTKGQEISSDRIVGEINTEDFTQHLQQVLGRNSAES